METRLWSRPVVDQIMAKSHARLRSTTNHQTRSDEPHSVHLNGRTQGPHSQSFTDNMFLTPSLKPGNEIIIIGQLAEDKRLNIEFGSGTRNGSIWQLDSNICRINISNRIDEADAEDYIKISTNKKEISVDSSAASDWFTGGSKYVFKFRFHSQYIEVRMSTTEDTLAQEMAYIDDDEIHRVNMISVDGTVKRFNVNLQTEE